MDFQSSYHDFSCPWSIQVILKLMAVVKVTPPVCASPM